MKANDISRKELFAGTKIVARRIFEGIAAQKLLSLTDLTQLVNKGRNSEGLLLELGAHEIALELLAGSIIQVACKIIELYGRPGEKRRWALHFESEVNRLVVEYPGARLRLPNFSLPREFCLGRNVGHLPLGVVVYAARNQYNHFEDARLSVLNEVVFNHLDLVYPDPKPVSFDIKGAGRPLAYSALAALQWVDGAHENWGAFELFCEDMSDVVDDAF